jgi:hypothetical protein
MSLLELIQTSQMLHSASAVQSVQARLDFLQQMNQIVDQMRAVSFDCYCSHVWRF